MHPNQNHISARSNYIGDVELLHEPAALANSYLDAVQPHPVDRFDTVEAQQDPLRRPFRQREDAAMISCRVLIGNMRWVDRERIADIGVDRPSVRAFRSFSGGARQYPMRGRRNGVPGRVVEIGIGSCIVKAVRNW